MKRLRAAVCLAQASIASTRGRLALKAWLLSLIDRAGGVTADGTVDEVLCRRGLVIAAYLFAGLTFGIWLSGTLTHGLNPNAVIGLLAAAFYASLPALQRRSYAAAARALVVGTSVVVAAWLASSGGVGSPGGPTLLAGPVAAAFLLGRRWAVLTGLVVAGGIAVSALLFGDGYEAVVLAATVIALTAFSLGFSTVSHALLAEVTAARAEAEASSTAKSTFLATMSHEIRTPMNGVLGMAQVLAADPGLTEAQRDQVANVQASGETMVALLSDILDLSKIEAGQLRLDPAPCAPRADIEHVIALYAGAAAKKGITLTAQLCEDVPGRCLYDRYRLRQCLSNLVSNAIKFTEEGGVTLHLSGQGDAPRQLLRVRVEDTGIGIAPEHAANLFSAFVQAEASTFRRYGGTGLGLAISKRLAEAMGGDLTLASEPGRGSVFTLTFAAETLSDRPAAPRSHEPEVKSASLAGLRVLSVDDNPVNRQVARLFLEAEGAVLLEAEGGQEALEAQRAAKADVLLLDLMMPGLDGRGVLAALRAEGDSSPVVILTAEADPAAKAQLLKEGAYAVLTKPLLRASLCEAVAASARRARRRPAAAQASGGGRLSP